MKRNKKLILITTAGLFMCYLIISTGFVSSKQQALVCHDVQIKVCDSVVSHFISPAMVSSILSRDTVKIIGERMENLNMYRLEQLLSMHSVIREAEVFSSIDGVLHINIYQRRPVIRLQTPTHGFYIDEMGYIFPLSSAYTSFVPVVTGNIPMSIGSSYRGAIPEREKFLKELFAFAMFLDRHEFWQAQIAQVHVKKASDITLTPCEGREAIHIGALSGYEYKLDKLMAFYRNAYPADVASPYSEIDLRYSNQIVCKRK
jgi:cell division protein FtsQ